MRMSLNNSGMALAAPSESPPPPPGAATGRGRAKKLLARFGVAGFLFFFIKGLLWLIIPGVIALWAAR